ncbi:MAG: phosphatase PAP2 family protein [Gaiellaceae bacterium]
MDGRIAVWVATHRVGFLNDVFVALGTIDKLGLVWVAAALAIGFGLRAGWRATIGLAALVAATTFAADAASFAVKDLVQRARPFEAHRQIHPLYVVHSSSFPAGHAATAFAGAIVLSYVVPRAAPLLLLVAAAIGFSRVYVGVHYPTDVLGGAAIGLATGAIAIAAIRLALRHRGTSGVALNVSS